MSNSRLRNSNLNESKGNPKKMDKDKRKKTPEFVGCLILLAGILGIMAFVGLPFVTIPAVIIIGILWLYRAYSGIFKGD